MAAMWDMTEEKITEERLDFLITEVLTGVESKAMQKNSAMDFSGETQAMYFSHTRNHLHSDIGREICEYGQQNEDLELLRVCKSCWEI